MGQVPLTERTSQPPVSKGFGVPVEDTEREEFINEVLNTRKKTVEEQAELAKAKAKAPEQKDTQLPSQPPASEPAFGDIGSLVASEKNIRDALTKKYEGQAELLAKQKEDLGYGMADFAQGLLKFAAADPTKATTQQLAEAFSDLPEKAKEATIQKRALELAESGLEADKATAMANREKDVLEMKIAYDKAVAGSGIDPQEAKVIMELISSGDVPKLKAMLPAFSRSAAFAASQAIAVYEDKKQENRTEPTTNRKDLSMSLASDKGQ